MTADVFRLGDEASLIDRVTLRVFRWWRGPGRDFVRAYLLTQLTIAALLAIPLTAVPAVSSWAAVGAVAAVGAPVAAWITHRRRSGWSAPASNQRAVKWGIGLGILFFLATGLALMVLLTYIGVVISMLAAQGPLALIPAIATGTAGWLAAAYRKRRLDDPVYPANLST